MDTSTIVAGAVAGLTITAAWLDLRKRTNGSGPLAKKLDEQTERLVRIEERVGRTEERVGRIESKVVAGARLDRAEEKRVEGRQWRAGE